MSSVAEAPAKSGAPLPNPHPEAKGFRHVRLLGAVEALRPPLPLRRDEGDVDCIVKASRVTLASAVSVRHCQVFGVGASLLMEGRKILSQFSGRQGMRRWLIS